MLVPIEITELVSSTGREKQNIEAEKIITISIYYTCVGCFFDIHPIVGRGTFLHETGDHVKKNCKFGNDNKINCSCV